MSVKVIKNHLLATFG